MSPIILVGAGILLFGLGLGLGYWFAHSQRKREATRASDIQNELDDYRRHVTEHFGETAQHFQTLGQQYQSLYKHMAQGADALCDPAQSDALLGFAAGNAAAITASTTDKPEKPPEVIRDYATEEEIDSPKVEPEVESSNTSESLENSSVPDDVTAEPSVEEVVADQVDTSTPIEKERTVH
ncbi:MAG: DUF1043 family protein [Gammaproteobacteria bacterium]|nr:DUF1043 family protein [Gammaproteobacteria bacterium]